MRVTRTAPRVPSVIVLRDLQTSGKFYVYLVYVPPPVSSYDAAYEFIPQDDRARLTYYSYTLENLPLNLNLNSKVYLNTWKGQTDLSNVYFYALAEDPTTGNIQTETNADFMNCNKIQGSYTYEGNWEPGTYRFT